MNTDEIVESLQPYGAVHVYQNSESKGFRASADLFMRGIKAEVCSDFGHTTLLSAMIQLQERVFAVVQPGKTYQLADQVRTITYGESK